MTKASVKPALKRIEEKLDSIDQRICAINSNCNSIQVNDSNDKENQESQEDSKE